MAAEKARVEKDKGNAAFKAGDYATAVGHYSAAIIHDRDDYTLPLNRAAAYLKLGKNEDASRDCTTVLSLNPSNVKALFRRGQARVEMQMFTDAQEDFQSAAKIEPNNQAVKEEMEKLRQLPLKKSPVQGGPAPQKKLEISPGVRRRVPIKIIESEPSPQSISAPAETKATSSVVSTSEPASVSHKPDSQASPPPATPKTFQDAKKARDEVKPPPRVGGGIFRASGKNTIFTRNEPEIKGASVPSIPATAPRQPIHAKSFATLFDFNKAWLSVTSPVDRFQLISNIQPTNYPTFFKTSLEPSLFTAVVQCYLEFLGSQPNAIAQIKQSMEGFLNVPRITTVALFLSRQERDTVAQLLDKVGDQALTDRWKVILRL